MMEVYSQATSSDIGTSYFILLKISLILIALTLFYYCQICCEQTISQSSLLYQDCYFVLVTVLAEFTAAILYYPVKTLEVIASDLCMDIS